MKTAPNPSTVAAVWVPGTKKMTSVIVLSKAVKSRSGLKVLKSRGKMGWMLPNRTGVFVGFELSALTWNPVPGVKKTTPRGELALKVPDLLRPSTNSLTFLTPMARILARIRILVVEDDDDNREVLAQSLTSEGAIVTAVATAADALPLLSSSDIILTDYALPKNDGPSTSRPTLSRSSQ